MPEQTQSKNILKSKTFWFNIAGGVLGLFTNAYAAAPEYNPAIMGALVAGNVFLRGVTNQQVTVLPKED